MVENDITARRLKACRERSGETLEQIGQLVGVNKTTVMRWERGDTWKINIPTLQFLANHFHVSLQWLLGDSATLSVADDNRWLQQHGIAYEHSVLLPIMGSVRAGVGGAVGTIQIFYSLVSKFFNPIQNLADQLNELQRAFTSSERLFNLMDNKPDFVDEPDAIEIESFKGEIEFKNVWFAYKEGEWVLKDVSFHVLPKQTVAFVGATGAGKTTILQLIVRNYDVNQGEILIDGINVKKIKLSSLRKAIGQMLQDVFLFSGTIKSNINLRDDSITDEDIRKAIEYVNADSFIDKLPSGLEEQVTEGGKNFSSGQRQLLSFARTVVHKPQILILDEATANIDTETEQVIQQSLLNMMNIGTMLIVAHRLSTIQHSDNIICLQKGEIVEQGDHQTLLKNHGYYYNLYRLQYEDQER